MYVINYKLISYKNHYLCARKSQNNMLAFI